jgi:hypothetical protein
MSRCMLQNRCVPNRFWVEAVFTAVYLLNRSPTMAVKQKTPEEAWSGRKPKVSHLKVFGSTAYTWIPAAKRTKLDPKSKKMMLTGYSDTHKAYRLVDVDTDKVSFSKDVVDEEVGPFHTPPAFRVTEQPEVIEDSGVKLPIAPPEGGKDSEHDDEESKQDESPRSVRSVHSEAGSPSHGGNTDLVARDSKRPKWWHNTIGDVQIGEMIEGRSSQGKSKQQTGTVNFALMANIQEIYEHQVFKEAKARPEWEKAMEVEHESLMKNQTWDLTALPSGKKPIGCKWVYKVKYKADGTLDKYKARLVAKGFSQREGIDYEETFAPTAKMSTIRLVLAMAAQQGWKVHQLDVKSAFLNEDLKELVYMCQPKGFQVAGKEHLVCRLKKALYGLKQAPRAWYIKIDRYLVQQGFQRSPSNSNLYVKRVGNEIILLVVYVDDIIITGSEEDEITWIKSNMGRAFDMQI